MEDFLVQKIAEDVAIHSLVGATRPVTEWLFAPSSLGLGDNPPIPDRPYIVYNELTDLVHQAVRETSSSRNRNFQIFVYDHKGDFTRINQILKELRRLVKGLAPFTTADGVRCSESVWSSMSGNIVDDGFDSCVRFGTAVFTVSE